MNVFVFWENKKPYYIEKCLNRMKDVFKDKLIILNYKNLKNYIPYLPQHLFKIREIAIQVDYIRMAVLYYNSGVYIDADCIVFPSLLPYLEKIYNENKDKDLIGLGKNNILDANNFLIAPNKYSSVIKEIMKKQEKIIENKRGTLYWTEIGGEILQKITLEHKEKCLNLNPSPIMLVGWKNTDIFSTTNKEEILDFLDKIVAIKFKGIMLYNKIMKANYMRSIPQNCLLDYLLKN